MEETLLTEIKKNTIRSVDRALDILLCFLERKNWTLTELTKQTGLHKSTVFRLLLTLEEKGFLLRDADTEKYRLGRRIWELSLQLDLSTDPATLFLAEMEKLRDELEETVSLYVRDDLKRIRIQAVESQQAIRRVAPVGAHMSLTVGASSKVLVAYATSDICERIATEIHWSQPRELEQYQQQIMDVRNKGYAISAEERELGTAAIAVPIFDRKGIIIASLAISGPISRMSQEKMIHFLPRLQQAALIMGQMVVG